MNSPWSREELAGMRQRLADKIGQAEAEEPSCRALPPMAEQECLDMMFGLLAVARQGALASAETFLFGQLLSTYRQAIEARMLGKSGRYFVISEADVERLSSL